MKSTADLTKASNKLSAAILKLVMQITFLTVLITGLITVVVNNF